MSYWNNNEWSSNKDDALSIHDNNMVEDDWKRFELEDFEDIDLRDDDEMDDETSEDSFTDIEYGVEEESSFDDESTAAPHTDGIERSHSIATLLMNKLREKDQEWVMSDPRLSRRARDFAFARSERAKYCPEPMVKSLYPQYFALSLVWADLQWAEDAAWRRQNRKPYIRWKDYEEERKKKSWKRPCLTYFILAAQAAVMIYMFYLSNWTAASLKENSFFGPSQKDFFDDYAVDTSKMVQYGSWYRLVSATFVHAGVFHYLLNQPLIYLLGIMIERNHGMSGLALVYFLPSVAAYVLSALLNPGAVVVGSSGGVFGLIGACVADIMINWNLMFLIFKDDPGLSKCCLGLKCACVLIIEIAFYLLAGFAPIIDNFAHLGGFIYGFLAGYVVFERLPLSFFGKGGTCSKYGSFFFRFLAASVMAFAIASSSVKLSQSDGTTVPYPTVSRYMNCLELPFWTDEKWWYCDKCNSIPLPESAYERNSSNIFDKTITKIELECPDGSKVIEDVSGFEYDAMTQFSKKDFVGFCRTLC